MATRKPNVRRSAANLSRLGARRGGEARAAVLTAEERREISRKAVLARWKRAKGEDYQPPPDRRAVAGAPPAAAQRAPQSPRTRRSVFRGRLKIGSLDVLCHVLSDGSRIFEYTGTRRRGQVGTPANLLVRYVSGVHRAKDDVPLNPVEFRSAGSTGALAGLEATELLVAAESFLEARERGTLPAADAPLAKLAEIVVRASAGAGIHSLFDAATGYGDFRVKRTLRLKLLALVTHDLPRWSRAFPEDFWTQLSRLEGIRHRANSRPLRWVKHVVFFLHDALAREVEAQPWRSAPESRPALDLHEWLDRFGENGLGAYMDRTVVAMRACQNMDEFTERFARVFESVAAQAAFDETPHSRR